MGGLWCPPSNQALPVIACQPGAYEQLEKDPDQPQLLLGQLLPLLKDWRKTSRKQQKNLRQAWWNRDKKALHMNSTTNNSVLLKLKV